MEGVGSLEIQLKLNGWRHKQYDSNNNTKSNKVGCTYIISKI